MIYLFVYCFIHGLLVGLTLGGMIPKYVYGILGCLLLFARPEHISHSISLLIKFLSAGKRYFDDISKL